MLNGNILVNILLYIKGSYFLLILCFNTHHKKLRHIDFVILFVTCRNIFQDHNMVPGKIQIRSSYVRPLSVC